MASHSSVEAYLASLPDDQRTRPRRAPGDHPRRRARGDGADRRTTCRRSRRAAGSSSRTPAFTRHFSLFPASQAVRDALGEEIAPFLAGKGTIRFTAADPLPADLVAKIVAVRLVENAARRG